MTDFNIYDKNGNGGSIAAMARTVVESMIADGSLATGGSVDPDEVASAVESWINTHKDEVAAMVNDTPWTGKWRWALSSWNNGEWQANKKITGNTPTWTNGTAGTWGILSEFIPVTPGETIHVSGYISYHHIYGYNANKGFVKKITSELIGGNKSSFSVPDGIYYLRCSTTVESDPSTTVFDTFDVWRDGYGYYPAYNAHVPVKRAFPTLYDSTSLSAFRNYLRINSYGDKYFGFIGDSFSAPGIWQKTVCNNLCAKGHLNKATSGGGFVYGDGSVKNAFQQAKELVTSGRSFDVFVITLGTNDAANKRTVGTFNTTVPTIVNGDTTATLNNIATNFGFDANTGNAKGNQTTFYNGVQACLCTLMQFFPNAEVFVGYTPNAGQSAGDVADDSSDFTSGSAAYISAMKNCCMRYGVRYIETRACGYSGNVPALSGCFKSATDGHPSNEGQAKIAKYMTSLLASQGGWYDL